MKHATWFVAVAFVVLSGMAVAQLIGSTRVVAQVPFEFMVANKIVPAGECEVQAITMDGQTLVIRNAEAKVGLFSGSSQAESKQNASNYALVFKHYGEHYFLSEIRLQGSKITYRLPESKLEVELRAQNVSATEETLRASLK
jgi:hypothetical protein